MNPVTGVCATSNELQTAEPPVRTSVRARLAKAARARRWA